MIRIRQIESIVPALLLAAVLAGCAPLGAAEGVLRLDAEATTIAFTLGATLHTVEGSFDLVRGEIRFDPATGEAGGSVVVDVTSGDTGKKGRDEDMHQKVLESSEYPRAVFTPESFDGEIAPDGTSSITLEGTLTLHGSEHPVTLPTEVSVDGDRVEATGGFRVPYVEWGMKDPSKFLLRVDKHVDVTVDVVGRLEAPEEP